MAMVDDGDDLVTFRNVRIISATASSLFCGIAGRNVWLPRRHVSGRLCCLGDRGTLLIRRWVARDRKLIHPLAVAPDPPLGPSMPWRRLLAPLHLVRAPRGGELGS